MTSTNEVHDYKSLMLKLNLCGFKKYSLIVHGGGGAFISYKYPFETCVLSFILLMRKVATLEL
jgi:hypothetical protein